MKPDNCFCSLNPLVISWWPNDGAPKGWESSSVERAHSIAPSQYKIKALALIICMSTFLCRAKKLHF